MLCRLKIKGETSPHFYFAGGLIGLLAILTGAVVSVFFGYITDRIRKHIKVCDFDL